MMDEWLKQIRIKKNKRAMPVLTFPAIQLLNTSVEKLISDSNLQSEALKLINQRCHPLAIMGFMDLSVEAEAFGANIRFSEDEVPTVVGSIVKSEEDAINLKVPKVGTKRTKIYLDAMKKAKQEIKDCPVFAGCIGPFSLAGRLLGVSEAMICCYDEPEMVHLVLKKATEFLINYLQAYKDLGIDGVFMAEPLAGILSPNLCDEFSSRYVKEIVSALDDDSFLVAYHNCGNNTLKMVDTILSTGCRLYHFGNAISIEQMLKLMPKDVMVMGNIDPVSLKDGSREDVIAATNALLEAVGDVDNFVISSGCDIPPLAKWENIDAFMKTAQEYYQK
ncbi:MAG TPA: uroporphyrinogen decarboxylase family protein [Candidatus Erysipelatoclostridium merdavium]|uniref:Uroporphyrinogen decarboxylase family protein n=1 Tax=Candidatus Erysipelatoclostridium merdavium TaxID=2838566 RepID=A0A9D2BML6_9FIRM|nr:uroporphyrinogen decarboxylase family protein [Candidatus Erysipelatoclostridium merdavium]